MVNCEYTEICARYNAASLGFGPDFIEPPVDTFCHQGEFEKCSEYQHLKKDPLKLESMPLEDMEKEARDSAERDVRNAMNWNGLTE